MKVKSESEVAQLCRTLCDPMDLSPPDSSIHGIFQARVLECGAIAFSIAGCLVVKNLSAMQIQSLNHEDPLEKEMATHSSILAWETPWTQEPGGLQSMGSQRVRHD